MPILNVEVVGPMKARRRATLAGTLAEAAAKVLSSRPHGTWVRVHDLPITDYAENEGAHAGVYPVFVTILKADRPEGEVLETETRLLTEAIAAACDRPVANVHILYLESARGRQAFGGKVVK